MAHWLPLLAVCVLSLSRLPVGAGDPKAGKPTLDRLGDPLPPGAVARFGNSRLPALSGEELRFSPDGKRLALSGSWGARIWNLATGRVEHHTHLEGLEQVSLDFTPAGAHLLCESKRCRIIDPQTGKVRRVPCFRGPWAPCPWGSETGHESMRASAASPGLHAFAARPSCPAVGGLLGRESMAPGAYWRCWLGAPRPLA